MQHSALSLREPKRANANTGRRSLPVQTASGTRHKTRISTWRKDTGNLEFKAGLADLKEAVRLDPKNLDAQYHLGMAHYFLRDFKEAAAHFESALNLAQSADSVIDCSNWLFVSLQRAGDPARASEVLARIGPSVKNTE